MPRVIVHNSRRDELVEQVVNMTKSLSVGLGIEPTTFSANMGAMVTDGQRDRPVA